MWFKIALWAAGSTATIIFAAALVLEVATRIRLRAERRWPFVSKIDPRD